MRTERGNFLLQALLALTLVFAFIPFFVSRMAARDNDAQMYAATRQIVLAQTAARIYVRENADKIPYETTTVSGSQFSDLLEPYGLPLGFVPRTALGQDISLVLTKADGNVTAYLDVTGGNLSGVRLAELARRVGYYATPTEKSVLVGLALDDVYSDVVRRNEKNMDNGAFLTDLDMDENRFTNAGSVFARRGEFDTAEINTLSIYGTENGRKEKNMITSIDASKAVFQSATGESALTLSRGTLNADNVDVRTISRFGDTGNFESRVASVYNFAMTAGRTNFTGPSIWNVRGNVVASQINFSVERLEVKSFINAARGQDVYINPDALEYSSRSGIETDSIITSNITLRDQTSTAMMSGSTGAVVLDIRPGGTSLLPDALLDSINNDSISILRDAASDNADTVDCKTIINGMNGRYNQKSLSQYIICQYLFWRNLEQRIDIKQCLLDGRSDCE